jgi:hypothetical protein
MQAVRPFGAGRDGGGEAVPAMSDGRPMRMIAPAPGRLRRALSPSMASPGPRTIDMPNQRIAAHRAPFSAAPSRAGLRARPFRNDQASTPIAPPHVARPLAPFGLRL